MKLTLVQALLSRLLAISYARTIKFVDMADEASGRSTSETSKIVFSKDWKETLHGTLEPGNEVRIEYAVSRLPNRDTRYGDWHEYVKGALQPGGQFQVVYDSIRLPWHDMGYAGMGYAWNIFAHAQFSTNRPVVQQMLQGGNQGGNPNMTTIYDIPEDAQEVIMWFYFSGYIHNLKWDTNQGQNYHFSLSTK